MPKASGRAQHNRTTVGVSVSGVNGETGAGNHFVWWQKEPAKVGPSVMDTRVIMVDP